MKKLTGFYIGVYGKPAAETRTINDDVDELQKIVGCRCFDIVHRKIGGKCFDIICDDEGLFRDQPVPSAINGKMEVMLVGNLFICRHKGAELQSLTDSDVEHIKSHLYYLVHTNTPVVFCEY